MLDLESISDWTDTDIDVKALFQLITINKSVWGQSYSPFCYIVHAEETLEKTGVSN